MNSRLTFRKRMPTAFGPFFLTIVLSIAISIVLAITSAPVQAQVFQWQENSWPAEDMHLSKVAASGERLIAVGRIGTSPDFEPVAVTSTDGRNWQIVDLGLAGRFVSDILHTDDGFILALEDGSLRIGDPDQGWDEIVPPDEVRLRSPSLVKHQGRLLMFGMSATIGVRTAMINASADLQTWETLFSQSGNTIAPFLSDPASTGSALALIFVLPAPAIGIVLGFSTDGSTWEFCCDGLGGSNVSSPTVREETLFAVVRDIFQGIQPLRIARRAPSALDWELILHPEILVESASPIRGGPPGLVLRATIEGQQALLAGVDGSSWTRQAFTPSGFTQDFVAWQGGWVGVGDTVVLGRPQGSVPVPTLSIPGVLLLALGLLSLARFSRRQRVA